MLFFTRLLAVAPPFLLLPLAYVYVQSMLLNIDYKDRRRWGQEEEAEERVRKKKKVKKKPMCFVFSVLFFTKI